jgi:hypothetical protein
MRSVLAALPLVACAPIGPDPGSDAGTGDTGCTDVQVIQEDWTMSANDMISGSVPSTCYQLAGALTITGGSVDSLGMLGDLRGVVDLTISQTMLPRLDSTSPIHVTGALDVDHNFVLTDLSNIDLEQTDSPTGITIEWNAALTDLSALGKLSIVPGPILIDNNMALTTIDLSSIARAEGGLTIDSNPATKVVKLDGLTSVTHDLMIENNAALTQIELGALKFVHGNFILYNDGSLATLDHSVTSPLTTIDANLEIANNAILTSLGELAHTGWIGGQLEIMNNASLLYCQAREVGCCVGHGSDIISGNKTSTDANCPHSWCFAQNNNSCPFQY